jgi:hypothetical protein
VQQRWVHEVTGAGRQPPPDQLLRAAQVDVADAAGGVVPEVRRCDCGLCFTILATERSLAFP